MSAAPRARRWRLPAAAAESAWVGAGTYALYGAMLAATVLIARAFGADELGRFGIAWALAQLTVQAAVAGASALHRRDVARAAASDEARHAIPALAAATVAVRAALVGAMWVLAAVGLGIAWAAGVLAPTLGFAVGALLVAKGVEAVGMAWAETVQASGGNRVFGMLAGTNAAALGAGVALATTTGDARAVYAAVVLAAVLYVVASAVVYRRRFGSVRVQWPGMASVRALAAESWPLVANAVVFAAQARVAVLAVGALAGATAAGAYTFAAGVAGGAAVVASAVGTVLFPRLCAQHAAAPETLRATMWQLVWRMGALGVVVAQAVVWLREPLVALYGGLPPEASGALAALAIGLVAVYAGVAPSYLFTAIGAQRDGLRVAVWIAGATVVLVVTGAAAGGAVGAAVGASAAQALGLALAVWRLERRHVGPLAEAGRVPAVRVAP